MSKVVCQSCGMPMETEELMGKNCDGTVNSDYCTYCYQNGAFTAPDMTMQQMVDLCVPYMVEQGMDGDAARKTMDELLPKLKRWQ